MRATPVSFSVARGELRCLLRLNDQVSSDSAGIPSSAGRRSSRIVARRWASLTDVRWGNNNVFDDLPVPVVGSVAVVLNGSSEQIVSTFRESSGGFRLGIIHQPTGVQTGVLLTRGYCGNRNGTVDERFQWVIMTSTNLRHAEAGQLSVRTCLPSAFENNELVRRPLSSR